jgi:hypothetical protein
VSVSFLQNLKAGEKQVESQQGSAYPNSGNLFTNLYLKFVLEIKSG